MSLLQFMEGPRAALRQSDLQGLDERDAQQIRHRLLGPQCEPFVAGDLSPALFFFRRVGEISEGTLGGTPGGLRRTCLAVASL